MAVAFDAVYQVACVAMELPDWKVMTIFLAACLGIGVDARAQGNSPAQDNAKEPPKLGWSNNADLSLVLTAGNSAAMKKVRLQWLYEKEPALESDLDVIAFVEVINPDGIPGSGDERFRTRHPAGRSSWSVRPTRARTGWTPSLGLHLSSSSRRRCVNLG